MSDLTEAREAVDRLDAEIAALVAERMEAAVQAALARRGDDLLSSDEGDSEREHDVVAAFAERAGISLELAEAIYTPIFAAVRGEATRVAREMAEERLAEAEEESDEGKWDHETAEPAQLGLGFAVPEKPPYAVPTVRALRSRVLVPDTPTVVSTFSGAGGSCLGFRMAGYNVAWASEFIPAARETYLANFPETVVDPRDIREVTADEILETIGREKGDVDVLEGSPPCASFSMAGKREEGWGQVKKYSETEQRVDDLFFEFARLLKGIRPRVFVAENVPGLLLGNAMDVFKKIMSTFRECGYVVDARVLNSYHFGVPQARRRLIFMGVRKDLGLKPAYPRPQNTRYNIRDALPWIVRAVHDTRGFSDPKDYSDGPVPTITISGGGAHSHHKIEDGGSFPVEMAGEVDNDISPGQLRAFVEKGVAVELHNPTSAFSKEPRVEQISPTIMAGGIGGFNTSQYRLIVERLNAVYIPENHAARRDGKLSRRSVMPTLKARGISTGGATEYEVETETADVRAIIELTAAKYDMDPDDLDAKLRSGEARLVLGEEEEGLGPTDISTYAIGEEWENVEIGTSSDRYFNLIRPDPNLPCPTITQTGGNIGAASVVHPLEKRKFTIPELRRLCSFPDDFVLTGTYQQRWERLGRSVPPLMMKAVAEAVREQILERIDS